MNEKKFIQLLNLYIDGEATPPEAREVELEIESNPARRRVYDDYCRIQAATRALYGQFRREDVSTSTEAGQAGRIRAAGVRHAAARPGHASGSPFRRVLFWAGGAAAACLALAVAFWSLPRTGGEVGSVQTADAPGVSVPTVESDATAVASTSPATYTAPFASTMRTDPYLVGDALPPGDPFALTSAPRQNAFGEPDVVLDFSPAFTSSGGVAGDPAAETQRIRKLQSILQREAQPAQGQFVPVNLRQQP